MPNLSINFQSHKYFRNKFANIAKKYCRKISRFNLNPSSFNLNPSKYIAFYLDSSVFLFGFFRIRRVLFGFFAKYITFPFGYIMLFHRSSEKVLHLAKNYPPDIPQKLVIAKRYLRQVLLIEPILYAAIIGKINKAYDYSRFTIVIPAPPNLTSSSWKETTADVACNCLRMASLKAPVPVPCKILTRETENCKASSKK